MKSQKQVRFDNAHPCFFTFSPFHFLFFCVPAEQETLLFRGTGIRCAIIAQSGIIHGRAYLQAVIGPVLHDYVQKTSRSLELDPLRLNNSTKELQRNAESIVNVCNHLLAALLSAADAMPMYETSSQKKNGGGRGILVTAC